MFPKSEDQWIEEPIRSIKKNGAVNSIKEFNIEPNKIFYYMDAEDIAFRLKLNYLIINSTAIVAENKIWGMNIIDVDTDKLLFALQLNDTKEDCYLELLDENKNIKETLKGVISTPENEHDNIKITMITDDNISFNSTQTGKVVSFFLDFKFPNKLIYKNIPSLIGKDLNCYLTYYILGEEKTNLVKVDSLAEINVSSKADLSSKLTCLDINPSIEPLAINDTNLLTESLSLDDINSLLQSSFPKKGTDLSEIGNLTSVTSLTKEILSDEDTKPVEELKISDDVSLNNL